MKTSLTWRKTLRALIVVTVAAYSTALFADVVKPLDDVKSAVTVRKTASAQSAKVGVLAPGQSAELLGSVPNWHRVKLSDGTVGFVLKRWITVVPSTAPLGNSPAFTIDVVDVGTGLGVLVRGPDFTLIYDGGSNDDLARGNGNRFLAYIKNVAPALTTIDELILSHPHRDHVELLPDVFGAYQGAGSLGFR